MKNEIIFEGELIDNVFSEKGHTFFSLKQKFPGSDKTITGRFTLFNQKLHVNKGDYLRVYAHLETYYNSYYSCIVNSAIVSNFEKI